MLRNWYFQRQANYHLCDFRTDIIHVTWMFMNLTFILIILMMFLHKIKRILYILFMFLCLLLIVLLECQSGQTKEDRIGTWYFYAKHAALRRKSKGWLARNHDNVSEWGDMSVHGLLFQWASVAFNCVL